MFLHHVAHHVVLQGLQMRAQHNLLCKLRAFVYLVYSFSSWESQQQC